MKCLFEQVERLVPEMIQALQEMVRIPTVNPPGTNYEAFARYFQGLLDRFGYDTEVVEVPRELLSELAPRGQGLPRFNVIGRLRGQGAGPRVCLNGHYDVVPAGSDWTFDPFGGDVINGKLYGRGTADMKSGLAMQVFAVEALRRSGLPWSGEIMQCAVPDEETVGNRNAGTGFLVEQRYISRETTDAVIITEPFGPNGIGIGHKGAIWGEITVFGKQAHGSAPSLGVNAVQLMAEFLHLVEVELQPKLCTRMTELSVTPSESVHSTLSFDTIHGGEATNVIPARCSVTFNRRLLPSETVASARVELKGLLEKMQCLNPQFRYQYKEFYTTEPVLIPQTAPLAQVARQAILDCGMEPQFLISAGSDDQRFIVNDAGIHNCIIYGPGQTWLSHQSDEYIEVNDLVTSTKVLALILYRLMAAERGQV